ncbi:MAG: hypothetical protein ACPLRM_07330, partial [Anaerolineae bacterium]
MSGPRGFPRLFVRRRISEALLIAVLCFVLAVFAQRNLDRKVRDYRGYLPYGIAAVVFALAFGGVALEECSEPDEKGVATAVAKLSKSIAPVAVSLLIALLGCLDFGG